MTLETDLAALVGASNVLTGSDAAPYGRDWTGQYPSQPRCVVRPGTTAEVSEVVKACAEACVAMVPAGGNTGLTGASQAEGMVMISLERMAAIREVRPAAQTMVVEAGAILDTIRAAADEHGLVFPLTFGARGQARIGGCLATNAGGSNVLRYGSTRALCLGLEVVLPSGEVLDLMSALHKDNSGYDLRDLFIGAEGTLGVITAAVLKLSPAPAAYATAMVATDGLASALALLRRVQKATAGSVEAFEYMSRAYMEMYRNHAPDAPAAFEADYDTNILIEIGATAPRDAEVGEDGQVPVVAYLEEVLGEALEEGAVLDAVIAQNEAQRVAMWARREAAGEMIVSMPAMVNNDVAVPVDEVGTFIDRATERVLALAPDARFPTVSHLGDGNVHYVVLTDADAGVRDAIMETVEDVVLSLGGSFSAEHGIGQSKKPSMRRRKDAVALAVMGQVKAALDPKGLMNPGKVLP